MVFKVIVSVIVVLVSWLLPVGIFEWKVREKRESIEALADVELEDERKIDGHNAVSVLGGRRLGASRQDAERKRTLTGQDLVKLDREQCVVSGVGAAIGVIIVAVYWIFIN